MFSSDVVPGRVGKDFHDDDCRRSAERDLRRTLALLDHHERQAEQLRARAAAYMRTNLDEADCQAQTVTAEQRRVADEAVAEARGMSRFLENHQGEFAADLLKLYRAVEPVLRLPGAHQTRSPPVPAVRDACADQDDRAAGEVVLARVPPRRL